MGQWTGSKLGKDASRLYIVTCLFNFYAEYIMRNARLEEVQAGIKISGSNINNLLKFVMIHTVKGFDSQ